MNIAWRKGLTATLVAGGTAGLASFVLDRLGSGAHMTSAISIGLGIGASRTFVSGRSE